eukprot:jgi/Mesvir1/15309/Mv06514-RA.1
MAVTVVCAMKARAMPVAGSDVCLPMCCREPGRRIAPRSRHLGTTEPIAARDFQPPARRRGRRLRPCSVIAAGEEIMPPPERDIVGSVNAVIEAESVREAVRIRPQKESANPGRMRLRATAVAGVCALAGVAACVGAWRVHHVNGGVRETVSSAVSAAMSNAAAALPSQPDQLLGHFRTTEAPEWDLAPVLADGSVKLRCAAAASFLSMQEAADWDGVYLVPLSGFRSVADQERVFFDIKAERAQMAHQRAESLTKPLHTGG